MPSINNPVDTFYREHKEDLQYGQTIPFHLRKGDLADEDIKAENQERETLKLPESFKEQIQGLLETRRVPFGLKDVDVLSQIEIAEKKEEPIKDGIVKHFQTFNFPKYPGQTTSKEVEKIKVECKVVVPKNFSPDKNCLEPAQIASILARVYATIVASDELDFPYSCHLRFTDCIPADDFKDSLKASQQFRAAIGKPLDPEQQEQEDREFYHLDQPLSIPEGTRVIFRDFVQDFDCSANIEFNCP